MALDGKSVTAWLKELGNKMSKTEKLYKYKTLTVNSLMELDRQMLWHCLPTGFNDPCDSAMHLLTSNNREQQGDVIINHLNHSENLAELIEKTEVVERFLHHKAKIEQRLKKVGICSFSAKGNNPLMWAHYANEHKGFCLEFTLDNETDINKFEKVNYEEEFNSFELMEKYIDSNGESKELDNKLLVTKSGDWRYEEEYRVIEKSGNQLYPFPLRLSAVIFGAKCSEVDIENIVSILSKHDKKPELKMAYIDSSSFSLEVASWSDERITKEYRK